MRANRNDKHHTAVVGALIALGCSVQSLTAVKNGCPDLLVGIAGRMVLIEVKTGTRKPDEDQLKWHSRWKGPTVVVLPVPNETTPAEVLRLCRAAMGWNE